MITHDLELAASLPRQIRMRDGLVEHDSAGSAAGAVDAAGLADAIRGAR
ncbi:hypothetical protein [Curtobacterium sp. MCBA15_001]